jgi:hypothetical protein
MKQEISKEILKKFALRGVHPVAAMFPLITGAEFDEFCASVKERGVELPISVNPEGLLLEGRNRLLTADKVGVECPKTIVDVEDEAGFIIAMNLHRRHLSIAARAIIAELLATMKHGDIGRIKPQELNLALAETSIEDAAKKMQVSQASVKMVRYLRTRYPKILAKAISGEMSLSAAHKMGKRMQDAGCSGTFLGTVTVIKPTTKPSKEEKRQRAELNAKCPGKLDEFEKLVQEMFLAWNAHQARIAVELLGDRIRRIAAKAQNQKRKKSGGGGMA